MNLKQLRYFCEVVEAGSAVHAAERLFVAPTAISMQLGQLEQHLGDVLFDRSRRPMELTSLGKYFYPRAKELLDQARRLDEEAHGIASGRHGWLGIGFVRSALFSILPTVILRFRESYPDVQLELVEVLSEYQPEQLREGRIHIGISRYIGEFEHPQDLNHQVMFNDPFVVALPKNHRLAKQTSVSTAELDGIPFITYPKDPRSLYIERVLSILKSVGSSPVVSYTAIEIHTALALVAAGLGVTLVGRSIAEHSRSDIKLLPISDLDVGSTMLAVTRANETSKIAAAFLEVLFDVTSRYSR